MLSVALSTAGLLWLGAASVVPSFAEVWNREVFDGDIEAAATAYEDLYMSSPSKSLRPEIRQKAAFRAGICFEKRGDQRSATRAFRKVLEMREKNPLLGSEFLLNAAAFRLQRFESVGGPSVGGRSRERRAAQKALMDLTAVESERRAALKSLANALEMQRGQLLGDRKLVDRLAGLGVFLSFPEDESSLVHTLEVIDSLRDAFPHETAFRRVQAALAGRFFLKALLDMERDRVQATKVARRELLDEETKQRGVVRREVRRLLAAATAAESTGRTHKAFEPLAEIRLRLDWTRPALRHDPEIRDIADRATRKFLLLGELSFEEGTLAQRWRDARSLSDAILLRAEELVDGMTQAARYRGRAVVGGRADAVDACREEVERLFAVAREALKAGDTAVVNSSVRQGQSILEWVLVEPPPEYRSFLKIFETEKSTVPGLKQG